MKNMLTFIVATIFTCMTYSSYAAPHELMDIEKETESHRDGIRAKEARPNIIEPWLANIHGKTLSTIGKIVTIRIRREEEINAEARRQIALTHQKVLQIIEHYELLDFSSTSVALDFPLQFSIEYSDGMRVLSYGGYAVINLPKGSTGYVVLRRKKEAEQAAPSNR